MVQLSNLQIIWQQLRYQNEKKIDFNDFNQCVVGVRQADLSISETAPGKASGIFMPDILKHLH